MASSFDLPPDFAALYGCAAGKFVQNGTAAIQVALRLLGLPRGSLVAVPSWCCWKVAFAVESEGHEVVEVAYDEHLQPCFEDIGVPVRSAVAAAVLVHYVGWPCSRDRLKAGFERARIIEDCAQAWGLSRDYSRMGDGADIVVTSMGPAKALDLGYGGAVFCHDAAFTQLDMDAPFPLGSRTPDLQALRTAIRLADKNLCQRRARADLASRRLERLDAKVLSAPPSGEPTWMRLPIACRSERESAFLTAALAREGVPFQLPWRRRMSRGNLVTEHSSGPILLVDIRDPHPWWSRNDGTQLC